MGTVESLAAWGIVRPAEVIEIADEIGLEVAAAATLLEKESAGGKNLWGSDGVQTGGTYVKGSVVTRAAYEAYRAKRRAGLIGSQGVGPTQLTWYGFQDAADKIGGCWEWRANVTVGFRTLRDLQRQHGTRDGFRRYNGSGPMAEKYAGDAMAKLAKWRTRLGPTTSNRPTIPPLEGLLSALTPNEQRELYDAVRMLHTQMTGDVDWTGGDPWGWPSLRHDGGPDLTTVDLARHTDREVNSRLGLEGRPGPDTDTLLGHVLSLRAELRALGSDVVSRLARLAQTGGVAEVVSALDLDTVRLLAAELVAEQGRRMAEAALPTP